MILNLESRILENKGKKELKCQRCGNIWSYKGNNHYVATCSYCHSTVSIQKNQVPTDSLVGAANQNEPTLRKVNPN